MTGRPRKPELVTIVRNAMLDAATGVFARKGYAAATMNEIAAAAGYTAPAFYKYFKGKQELFEALVDRMNAEALGLLPGLTTPEDASLAEHIEALFRATFALMERRAESFAVVSNIAANAEALPSVKLRKRQLEEARRGHERAVAWFKDAGIEEYGNVTAKDAAMLYAAVNQGIYHQWAARRAVDEKAAGPLTDLLPVALGFFLHGVCGAPAEPKKRSRAGRKKTRG